MQHVLLEQWRVSQSTTKNGTSLSPLLTVNTCNSYMIAMHLPMHYTALHRLANQWPWTVKYTPLRCLCPPVTTALDMGSDHGCHANKWQPHGEWAANMLGGGYFTQLAWKLSHDPAIRHRWRGPMDVSAAAEHICPNTATLWCSGGTSVHEKEKMSSFLFTFTATATGRSLASPS